MYFRIDGERLQRPKASVDMLGIYRYQYQAEDETVNQVDSDVM